MQNKKDKISKIAEMINSGKIKNLADVNWRKETNNWEKDKAKLIIDEINDRTLKPAIIDVMLSEYEYNRDDTIINVGFDMGFSQYLNGLKQHLINYDMFCIDTIKQRKNIEIEKIKRDIEELKQTVYPTNEKLNTNRAKEIFSKIKYCNQDGDLYRWTGTTALFGYMVDIVSDKLRIRPSNNRIPWKYFKPLFQMTDKDIETARQAVNDYSQKELPKPEGFEEIIKACE